MGQQSKDVIGGTGAKPLARSLEISLSPCAVGALHWKEHAQGDTALDVGLPFLFWELFEATGVSVAHPLGESII